jgi:GNAT superfamily N-acetyltransferase
VVDPAQRNRGTGGRLMRALEGWAAGQGYTRLWVATGGRAVDFYRKCGWEVVESFVRLSGEGMTVLTRSL